MIDLGLSLHHLLSWFHWYCDPTFPLIKSGRPNNTSSEISLHVQRLPRSNISIFTYTVG